MALESLARQLSATHGYMAGRGELLEYTVPASGPPIRAAGKALDRLSGISLPPDAWLSARVNLAPHPDDAENYKTLNGMSEVPTNPYKSPSAFADGLLLLTDNVSNKQRVLSITIRVAIPPRGFMAMHGDGLMAGPRVALEGRQVYEELPGGGAKRVTVRRVRKAKTRRLFLSEMAALARGEKPASWS